ncbi:hypothetical protein [Tropicimonas sp. IMCC6043]|uniref:hypothetical protein n=1 Tax=Tropicimonas sp. IMCC6043 TaxID=2510645 RepID=UPI00101BC3A5|nr:hypothetical protein [Tropicimonas sp. IMCC6043]RYH07223.1 hypothetical protein EU800_20880 [Tropicimonas sp. IMCC6043]
MYKRLLACVLSAVLLGGAANATIVGVGGAGQIFDATGLTAVTNATPGSNTNILGFDEAQGVLVATDLFVDGGFNLNGLLVDSHMIFLNRESGTSLLELSASFSFSGDILGVMTSIDGSLLQASDGILGLAGVTYDNFSNRGFESGDTVNFAGSSLDTFMRVTQPGDWMRVVTVSAVPVPAGAVLLPTALALLGAASRRRRRAA